ncbi:MAG: TIGR03668 family PPOX class F420-dependent oxidoreductase [Acidimicrobiia bacterium]|nr:TIGR03668 family PPOX class F420-dependent oxidoreductase [Acidimicrobiia bacterium]
MDLATARRRFGQSRSAYLTTTGHSGPHIVPIVFAIRGDVVVTAIDHKPKRSTQLQRLTNIAVDPRVSVLVDHYEDAWDALWWVRADGRARVETAASARAYLDLLVDKYPQYASHRPTGQVILIDVQRWRSWEAQSAKPG